MRLPNGWIFVVIATTGFAQKTAVSASDELQLFEWKGHHGCLVEFVKTPCRKVRYHEYSLGSSFGFDGITTSKTVHAVDREGSEAKFKTTVRRLFWLLTSSAKTSELLLRKQKSTVYLDHARRIFATEPHAASRGYQAWAQDDAQCSRTASHYVYLSGRLRDSVVAGIHVVGYQGRDDHGTDYQAYFAPSLGCQILRFKMTVLNSLGWTAAKYEMTVDQYEIGSPSADLFTLPAGYTHAPWQDFPIGPFKAVHGLPR